MAHSNTRAVSLRNAVDLVLQDISTMSAEELLTLGVSLEILEPGGKREPQVITPNPLRLPNGMIAKAPHAE